MLGTTGALAHAAFEGTLAEGKVIIEPLSRLTAFPMSLVQLENLVRLFCDNNPLLTAANLQGLAPLRANGDDPRESKSPPHVPELRYCHCIRHWPPKGVMYFPPRSTESDGTTMGRRRSYGGLDSTLKEHCMAYVWERLPAGVANRATSPFSEGRMRSEFVTTHAWLNAAVCTAAVSALPEELLRDIESRAHICFACRSPAFFDAIVLSGPMFNSMSRDRAAPGATAQKPTDAHACNTQVWTACRWWAQSAAAAGGVPGIRHTPCGASGSESWTACKVPSAPAHICPASSEQRLDPLCAPCTTSRTMPRQFMCSALLVE
jgi:hypothetical protein